MFFAKVLLHDPTGEDARGDLIVLAAGLEWQEVEYLEPEQCEHVETMCRSCRTTWEIDYEVVLNLI